MKSNPSFESGAPKFLNLKKQIVPISKSQGPKICRTKFKPNPRTSNPKLRVWLALLTLPASYTFQIKHWVLHTSTP
jgi:hypothetical protein